LCELGFELGDPGGQGISISNGSISLKYEVFIFSSQGGEPLGQVLAGMQCVSETNRVLIAGV
jgi:hypothetical protein